MTITSKRYTAEVKNMSYSIQNGLQLSLIGFPHLVFCDVNEIKRGGKNGEISEIVVGGKISFNYEGEPTRRIKNVTILANIVKEVDEEGNLITW